MDALDSELLHVDGKTFDTDDLTYGEMREIKRIARLEIWDEDVDGPFEHMNPVDLMPAIITVFMRRDDPSYTLEQALTCKHEDVFKDPGPPTKLAAKRSSPKRSVAAKASASSGSQS